MPGIGNESTGMVSVTVTLVMLVFYQKEKSKRKKTAAAKKDILSPDILQSVPSLKQL